MDFEIVAEKTVYTGRAFDLLQVEMRLPDKRLTRYDLVKHSGAVVIVPLDGQGNIWFVRQYRLGARDLLLEVPAGCLEEGEDPLVCAGRELREEIGMAAGKIEKLGQFFLAPGYSSEMLYAFMATDFHPDRLEGDADEFIETVPIPARQALEMVSRGEIHDAKTLACLMLAQPYLIGLQ